MRSHRLLSVLAILSATVLAGCGTETAEQADRSEEGTGASTEASTDAATDEADDLPVLRVASLTPTVFTVGMPHFVAEEQGFYEDAGFTVEPIFTDGGGSNVQAIVSGNADVATQTGTSAVLSAVSNGAELRILSNAFRGIDGLWVTEPDNPYEGLEDLAGQAVGYTSPGSSSHLAVEAFAAKLEEMGLEPIRPEAIGGTPDQLTAMSTDQIAAAYTNPPVGTDKIESGELRVVLNGFQELPEYADVSTRVIFTSSAFHEENPELVEAYLEAIQRTWDWIFENPEEAGRIWIEAAELDLTPEAIVTTFSYYEPDMVSTSPVSGLDQAIADAVTYGAIDEELTDEQRREMAPDEQ